MQVLVSSSMATLLVAETTEKEKKNEKNDF